MKILIVDDEPAIVDLIKLNLQLEGIDSISCNNGTDAIRLANSQNPDLILLDIMMPGMDGFQVCKELQGLNIPIILLTAKNSIKDKLYGLELGADDYITKPFDSRELIARVKTVLRRVNKYSVKDESLITAGPISVNIKERKVHIDEKEITLTPKEYDLLLFFIENQRVVFSRENILESVWGYEYIGDSRTVDMHIQRLRRKLGKYSVFIKTVFSIGYKFEVNYEA
ncbi:two-component system, OmpR family, response regulator VicR [Lutispora thermophila DSM 19022]|uniref:Stage 0 sporulation protein A homolog n=1 Tax=Lutispora thermophila DSM 19022 TaxID=1122184 RepID=A0A1M6EWI2_9FIRM|nr:response regulator transcription factor [Lutispora thermophila]SHI89857.1 two-component system, OmpR family, response regulator VicR [Lutispora thermophila DSM 19022]